MIVHLLYVWLNGALSIICYARPTWQPTLPASVSTFIAFDLHYDNLLPINETLTCLVLAVSFSLVMIGTKWLIKLADWIADVIP
jgi:hypothetical protein